MLEGFGLAPVCLTLDLDSYEGSPTHVMRFRGREGWLAVAELHIEGRSRQWAVPFAVGCDEYLHPIPDFMVPNLLACACSYPSPSTEIPPYELEHQLEEAEEKVLRRWLRSQSTDLRDFHQTGAEQLAALEARTDRRLRAIDRQISQLRRDRRMARYDLASREQADAAILRLEVEQDSWITSLQAARARLRDALEQQEDALLDALDVTTRLNKLYEVQWRGIHGQDAALEEARELAAQLQRHFPAGAYGENPDRRVYVRPKSRRAASWFTGVGTASSTASAQVDQPQVQVNLVAAKVEKVAERTTPPEPRKAAVKRPTKRPRAKAAPTISKQSKPALPLSPREAEKLQGKLEKLAAQERQFRESAERAEGKAWQQRLLMHANHCRKHINALEARLALAAQPATIARPAPNRVAASSESSGPPKSAPPPAKSSSKEVERPREQPQADRGFLVVSENLNWTDEQLALLKELWLQGVSASKIAERMGNKSRNAVVGKALRMRLPSGRANFIKTDTIESVSEAI